MSSIEERIEKHKANMSHAIAMFHKYNAKRALWDDKVRYHNNAIHNLRAKQEKKVD